MLSILIPTYNYNVEALVHELHAQSTACKIEFEIHIGDDFSNIAVISTAFLSDKKFTYVHRNDKSMGRTATRHLLTSKASYPWLLFIDADMLPKDKNYIKTYIAEISKDRNESAYFGGYSYPVSYDHKDRLRYRYGVKREYKLAAERNKIPYRNIYSGNMLIQKSTFIQTNTTLDNRY
ncbi:MAG: glycosyltransferase, partial [Flavobacteriaceae bacterium]|nr:glycosyltransferase [Flavobacteriaceae bacterium]